MSLIHWWPLNGNLNDYGLLNNTLTNNGTTFDNSGKIGKCAYYNGGATSTSPLNYQALRNYSVSCWVKKTNSNAGTICRGSSNFGIVLDFPNSSSIRTFFWYTSGAYRMYTANYSFASNVWYHVATTYDGISLKLYINGVLIGSSACSNETIYETGNFTLGYGSGYGYLVGCLNDVRIYDHTLSLKEVKEISKGLVLHYNFEDEYAEGTTNLITGITAGGQTSVSNGIVTTSGTNADTYFNLIMSESLTQGTVYTISCEASGFTGNEEWKWPIGGQNNSSLIFLIAKNGHNSFTFTMNDFNAGTNQCFMDDIYCSARETGNQYKFWNWQIEKKDHATPYVNGTRPNGLIYDNSGYGNNGTQTGSLQILEGSGSGNLCAYFNGNTLIKANALTSEGRTASLWYKGAPSYGVIFADEGSKLACGFYDGSTVIVSSQSEEQPYFNITDYYDPTGWNHFLIIKGTTTNSSRLFLNGVEMSIAGYSQWWTHSGGLWIGGRSAGTNVEGYLADFKIFATALSAEDILAEYNRKASIDKSGKLFAQYINEDETISNIKINKNAVIDVNTIAENITLEDGSVWTPIVVHNVDTGVFGSISQGSVFENGERWNNFGAISSSERPESGWWEFLVMHQNEVDGPFRWWRFKQNVNPLTTDWTHTNPSNVGAGVTRVGTNYGWASNAGAGMYWMGSSSCPMCFANTSNGNWYGCGIGESYGGGIPTYNNEVAKGFQLVYMRVSSTNAKMFKSDLVKVSDIEEC